MQGKEYIRTFKLNRKSYVVRRRTIETQQTELREKLKEYEEIVAKLLETENFKSDGEFLEKDIDEWQHILDEGANYRMTKNAFDNEIDELIVRKLKKVGEVKEVDEDYDLLYELEYNGETFLCHVAMIDIKIEGGDKIKKYISVDKIRAWESVGVADKVLLIFFNQQDRSVCAFCICSRSTCTLNLNRLAPVHYDSCIIRLHILQVSVDESLCVLRVISELYHRLIKVKHRILISTLKLHCLEVTLIVACQPWLMC